MENQELTFSPVSMSTKEIAPLVEKRHDHVLRDTKTLLTQVFDLQDNPDLGYEEIQGVTVIKDEHTGRISELLLDKRLTMTLVSGYNPKLRLRVIDRLEELETRALAAPSAKEMETRILASVMEQVKTLLEAPKQTQKRLPAPKKEFLPVDMLAQRHKLHLLLPAVGSMHFSYQDVAMHVLREQGLAEGTFIAPAPTEKSKGQYRLTRGRSPKLEWDAEDFKRAAEKTFNRTL